MTTQINADNLSPITHNQIPVITTELLAQLYGTETNNIKVNFSRNSDRFVCGKHYFKIEGDELRAMKHEVTHSNSVKIARNVRSLILWTERGAARHAKMLETDQAWRYSRSWRIATSAKRILQCEFHARKVTTREFSVISKAASLFPQSRCGMMTLSFPLSHGWNWREPTVGLLFAKINWWKN